MMIDTSEGEMSHRIARGSLVIYDFKTIFPDQIRPARQAKLKPLGEGGLNPVLRRSDRRHSVLNAPDCVACYGGKSREPVIGNREDVIGVEVRRAHVFRANIGLEIGLGLVSAVNVSAEGKPCREVMCERQSDVHVLIVRAHIEKLVKASHANQMNFCVCVAIIREDKTFSREK